MQVGIDANILLRAFLNDDPVQSAVSKKFLSELGEDMRGYVGVGALLDVLGAEKPLPFASRRVRQIVRALLSTRGVVVEEN